MDKEKYIQYLRDQAKCLNWLAEELENDVPLTTKWMIDWELHKEQALLEQAVSKERRISA